MMARTSGGKEVRFMVGLEFDVEKFFWSTGPFYLKGFLFFIR